MMCPFFVWSAKYYCIYTAFLVFISSFTQLFYCYEPTNVPNSWSVQVTLPQCPDPVHCYPTSMFECSLQGEEILRLHLGANADQSISSLPNLFNAHHSATLRLLFDKSVPHFEVFHTRFNQDNKTDKHPITDSVFYNRTDYNPKQFKSINEFHGTIEGFSKETVFIRGSVQFVDCGRVNIYAFIRHENSLYFLIPIWLNSPHQSDDVSFNKANNVHLLTHITDGIDSDIFRYNSKAFHAQKQKSSKKYCVIDTIVDGDFYRQMNYDSQLVVIYLQSIFLLANEIIQQNDEIQKYVFPHINIDITIARQYDMFTQGSMNNILETLDQRQDHCLLHFFTGKIMTQTVFDSLPMYGSAWTRGLGDLNFGATSIGGCKGRPWNVRCMLTFPHELFHNLGSSHDDNDDEGDNGTSPHEQYLMAQENDIDLNIGPNNLKLSNSSLLHITFFMDELKDKLMHKQFYLDDWSTCSNYIMEDGEQCDEGPTQMCCKSDCRLSSTSQCSPLNSLCCAQNCQFKAESCIPFNYCSDKVNFCRNKQSYCQYEAIEHLVDCVQVLRTTTVQTSTTTTPLVTAIPDIDNNSTLKLDVTEHANHAQSIDVDFVAFIVIACVVIVIIMGLIIIVAVTRLRRSGSFNLALPNTASPPNIRVPSEPAIGQEGNNLLVCLPDSANDSGS